MLSLQQQYSFSFIVMFIFMKQTKVPGQICIQETKGLFTWSGGTRSSGVGFFCFHALEDTKQKKPTPQDRGSPLHVNRVLAVSTPACLDFIRNGSYYI